MDPKAKMVAEARLFLRLALLSCLGLLFYYGHLFLGILNNAYVFKALAITFLLATVPLPIILVNNKKLFPELRSQSRQFLTLAAVLLLFHHFLMTFVFVLFLQESNAL
jgi:hypothetical protein